MPEKLRINDNVRTIEALRGAGLTYVGHSVHPPGQKESMVFGWFYSDSRDSNNIQTAEKRNIASLRGTNLYLTHEDLLNFPQYHSQIKKILGKIGLL